MASADKRNMQAIPTRPDFVPVHVKADQVIDNGNGTFTLLLPFTPLGNEDARTLERLFPNLVEQAHDLLNREALLSSIATVAEVQSKPKVPDGFKATERPGKRDGKAAYRAMYCPTPPQDKQADVRGLGDSERVNREDALDPNNPNGAVDIGD